MQKFHERNIPRKAYHYCRLCLIARIKSYLLKSTETVANRLLAQTTHIA